MCVSDTSGRSHQGFLEGSDRKAASVDKAAGEAKASRRSIGVRLLSGLVHLYRLILSPWIGPRCRFLPTCSEYALDALTRHGAIRGCLLTARRLARCHPLGDSGFDPVPETFSTADMFKSSKSMHKAGPGASRAHQTIGQGRPEPMV